MSFFCCFYRDIVSSVHYVNERYPQAGTSSSGSAIPPLTMFPLELASHKILYEKIPTGEYKIFLGDISTTNHWPKTMKKSKLSFHLVLSAIFTSMIFVCSHEITKIITWVILYLPIKKNS